MEVDFDIKNTGQTKAINGFDTRQVVATITVREKGKTIEQSGGIIMTVDTWLTKQASLKEIADFERSMSESWPGGKIPQWTRSRWRRRWRCSPAQGGIRSPQSRGLRRNGDSVHNDDRWSQEPGADEAAERRRQVSRATATRTRCRLAALSAASCGGGSRSRREKRRRQSRTPTQRGRPS